MAKRKLLKAHDLEIELRRRGHNRFGFAVQLCLMRHPGRVQAAEETSPRAMLRYVADQTAPTQKHSRSL